jgi:hypothetical protein
VGCENHHGERHEHDAHHENEHGEDFADKCHGWQSPAVGRGDPVRKGSGGAKRLEMNSDKPGRERKVRTKVPPQYNFGLNEKSTNCVNFGVLRSLGRPKRL